MLVEFLKIVENRRLLSFYTDNIYGEGMRRFEGIVNVKVTKNNAFKECFCFCLFQFFYLFVSEEGSAYYYVLLTTWRRNGLCGGVMA